jgi:hypothetical protein
MCSAETIVSLNDDLQARSSDALLDKEVLTVAAFLLFLGRTLDP